MFFQPNVKEVTYYVHAVVEHQFKADSGMTKIDLMRIHNDFIGPDGINGYFSDKLQVSSSTVTCGEALTLSKDSH